MNRFRKMVTVVTALFALQAAMAQDDVQITFDKLPAKDEGIVKAYSPKDDVQITFDELPAKAQSFVKTHFPKEEVASVWKDIEIEMLRVEDYTVALSNGTKVEFLPNGEWKEIKKSRGSEIPAKIIPNGIAQYVSQNYSGYPIKKISKERNGYEVELIGGTYLEFSRNGKFLRIGD